MSFENEFVALVCPQCGGEVKISNQTIDEQFLDLGDGDFIYIGTTQVGGQEAKCQHCGTAFVRKQTISLKVDTNGSGSVSINTNGGAFIGGNVNTGGGTFIGRDMKVIKKTTNRG